MNKDIQEFREKISGVLFEFPADIRDPVGWAGNNKDRIYYNGKYLPLKDIETFWLQKMKEHDQDIIKKIKGMKKGEWKGLLTEQQRRENEEGEIYDKAIQDIINLLTK